ncbi:MAG TPA: DUF4097 family beta strand repeat-containing protein [Ktedonobacteraceae bacterium]|nr:DUF4097 family beta strand repeat-containing protein [Ktedonobacteraceae bacterium]
MQEQEETFYTPEYTSSAEREVNADAREQRQWQTPPQQEYVERPYAEGYNGQDSIDAWFREDEKIRPRSAGNRGFQSLLAFIVMLCVLLIAGNVFGIIIGHLSWSFIAAIVGVLAIIGAFVAISNWRVVTLPQPVQTFSVTEHPRLLLNNFSGTVTIRRGEQNVVTVATTKHASGIKVNPEKMQVQYGQQDDTISVASNTMWNFFQFGILSNDFEITVPENSDIQATNGSGKIIIQGVNGDIRLKTGSGRIEGNDLRGRIALKTGSGRIALTDIAGQVTAATGSSRMEIGRAQLVGSSEFKTGSGGITFTGALDPRGNYRFSTGSGAVRFMLPPDTTLNLHAKTGSGRVVNDFASAVSGSGPRAQLTIKTGSGGIYVQRGY